MLLLCSMLHLLQLSGTRNFLPYSMFGFVHEEGSDSNKLNLSYTSAFSSSVWCRGNTDRFHYSSLCKRWCINTVISHAAWMRELLNEAESFWYLCGKWFSADHYTHWPVISSTTCEAESELSPWFIIYFCSTRGSASQAAWNRTGEAVLDTAQHVVRQCEIMALTASPSELKLWPTPWLWKGDRGLTGHPAGELCDLSSVFRQALWDSASEGRSATISLSICCIFHLSNFKLFGKH